ncbi:hypothetical protein DPMN_092239 [Dreissena polymorpha]|uniref:Uncharacterized protein n=1 Tax=Dreissena polymorpha TaxID=45954 RepID=A0A9D4L1L6_DREPO|nr:hypothetical protein DPMN_092239 [Dreissena polymorpha]
MTTRVVLVVVSFVVVVAFHIGVIIIVIARNNDNVGVGGWGDDSGDEWDGDIYLNGIYHTQLNGILLRARAQHVEHNEKNTKYFANIEKRRSEQKTVHKLVVNGKDITNRTEILEE